MCDVNGIIQQAVSLFSELDGLDLEEKVEAINQIREELHKKSPFKEHPVDYVKWVKNDAVHANDYNPNSVPPPEYKLLKSSLRQDGITMPIVSWTVSEDIHEVVDGYHRNRLCKEDSIINKSTHDYSPISIIKKDRTDKSNRMASTIRHNRARGEHSIDLMVNIVAELVESGMSDQWIAKNIGMDADELLRLKQISGLAALFKDKGFSKAWVKDQAEVSFYE